MNILQMSETLFYLIEQQANSEKAINYLRQQVGLLQGGTGPSGLQIPVFYRVFTALPRFVGKQPIEVPADLAFALEQLRPGFTVSGWTLDRLARVWWLLQLPADDESLYVKTITELFKAGELNELVALYSALPILAYPEAWRFQATEGIRNNIADVQSAIMLHNPYPADHFDEAAWNQLILKAFFTDKDVTQIIGLNERKNARLAHTLADYAAERRAAGRSLPPHIELLMD
ncbi:EboA domain-containing protein [Spirosoma sp. RP8]|uniref:EboA domain-containing protein n=1 Tax=Spirosoma liriopis TaxID=2937440 RepID=A0ABT0HGI8_9BACT|nr:EboA domain-containing protein [Spirosoma liriopis]MCK8491269.1 EboA domain-containing protein [Spirosoma liriopis]